VVVEILYSDSISGKMFFSSIFIPKIDSKIRRTVFSNAMNIIQSSKGKNIIFSSGSNEILTHRSPYDIVVM